MCIGQSVHLRVHCKSVQRRPATNESAPAGLFATRVLPALKSPTPVAYGGGGGRRQTYDEEEDPCATQTRSARLLDALFGQDLCRLFGSIPIQVYGTGLSSLEVKLIWSGIEALV